MHGARESTCLVQKVLRKHIVAPAFTADQQTCDLPPAMYVRVETPILSAL